MRKTPVLIVLIGLMLIAFMSAPAAKADYFGKPYEVAALKIPKKASPEEKPAEAASAPEVKSEEVAKPAEAAAPAAEAAPAAAPEVKAEEPATAAPAEEKMVAEPVAEQKSKPEDDQLKEPVEEDAVPTEPSSTATLLTIDSNPRGLKVYIDGQELGTTPIEVEGLSDKPHEVILYDSTSGAVSRKIDSGKGKLFIDVAGEAKAATGGAGFAAVNTIPTNVRIDVDGKDVGLSPMKIPLPAGKHSIVLSMPGYRDKTVEISVAKNETVNVSETLVEKPGSILVITSPPGASVSLDGHALGEANGPLKITDVVPGTHEVKVEMAGYDAWVQKSVMVQREKTETVMASLKLTLSEANVRIYTQPEGARVWLDGKEMGVTGVDGLGFTTNKGPHLLRMELNPAVTPGYRPYQVSLNFDQDMMDYSKEPIKIPMIDEAFVNAQRLFERGEYEEAISFLDRVNDKQVSYPDSRMMMVEVLSALGRLGEIPAEFEKLFDKPIYKKNPVLNLSMGYWCIKAAQKAGKAEAVNYLTKGIESLERAGETVDYFPAADRKVLAMKAHYYTGIAAEMLFDLTGEKKFVKKGVQAWELFFGRMAGQDETLGDDWVEKAKRHQRNLQFLEKKMGG